MENDLIKLKLSLSEAISKWIAQESGNDEWVSLNTYVGEKTGELMADAAMVVLLAQKDLSEYLRKENIIEP